MQENSPTIPTFEQQNPYFYPTLKKCWALLLPYFFIEGHWSACLNNYGINLWLHYPNRFYLLSLCCSPTRRMCVSPSPICPKLSYEPRKWLKKLALLVGNIDHLQNFLLNIRREKWICMPRSWCKTIVTTSFYIRSYNSFAPSPRCIRRTNNAKLQC